MNNQSRKAVLFLLLLITTFSTLVIAQNNHQTRAQIDSLNKRFNDIYYTDLLSAENLAKEALKLSIESGYPFGEASAYSNLSVVYQKKENNAKAIEAGFSALKIYDREDAFKKTFAYGNTLVRLAKAFFMEQDSNRSDAYGRQAIALAESIHDGQLLALGYESLGNNYAAALQIDSALLYYNKAKIGFQKSNYITGLANLANNTGAMYSRKGNNPKAIQYFKEVLKVYQENHIETSFTTIHFNIALSYFKLKSYDKALQHLDSAGYYAQKFKRLATLLDIYAQKARSYQGLGNLDSSASYFEKALSLKDTINNDTYKRELAALQTQSDVYKTETENKLLTKDRRIAVLYRNLAVAGIVVLAVVLAFFLLNQRLGIQRRVKNQLEEEVALRTQEIFRQKETIFQTNLRLKLALNGAKFDSHFAVHTLNAIQQVLLGQKPEAAQHHLAKLSHLMQYVLEKSPLEQVSLHEELQMIEDYIQLEQLCNKHHFSYGITIKANEHLLIPALLFQPYVENAIRNRLATSNKEDLHLHLLVETAENELTVSITDNGAERINRKEKKKQFSDNAIGQERLDLLTHLTHKNHLVTIEDLLNNDGSNAGTKLVLHIPIQANSTSSEVAQGEQHVEYN